MVDPLITLAEAAAWLRLDQKRLARLARTGRIPAILLPSGEVRFDRHSLAAWLRAATVRKTNDDAGSAKGAGQ